MPDLSWTESYGDKYFLDYDLSELKRDECWVSINNTADKTFFLHGLYEECINCAYRNIKEILPNTITRLPLNTGLKQFYRFLNESVNTSDKESTHNVICNVDIEFGEFGVYDIQISNTNCTTDTLKEPVSIYFPLITVFLIYAILFAFIPIGQFIWGKVKCTRLDKYPVSKEQENGTQGAKERVKSLDTFRGISIVLMIFVNYGGGGYPFLEHATWNGLNVADLVFPWFLWIMGVCIPMSVISVLKKGGSRSKAIRNVFRRSCILFGIGIFLGSSQYLDKLRIFGVLQRFGICYFFVATLCLATMSRDQPKEKAGLQRHFKDILLIRFQWIIILVVLAIYLLFLYFLEEPGCPTGYLGPGGYHERGIYFNCTGGATGFVDRVILGNHIYQWPTITIFYKSLAFDPEGILGCLPSIFQVFIGLQAGVTMIKYKENACRIWRWLIWAIITGVIGGALCGFSKEGGIIPVNKNLWSISFVLVTSSFAFILLSVCYYLIDMKKLWTGKPFLFAGMNSILMYVGHSMVSTNFPFHWNYAENDIKNTHFMSIIANIWATSLWVVVSYYLYKIDYFLSI